MALADTVELFQLKNRKIKQIYLKFLIFSLAIVLPSISLATIAVHKSVWKKHECFSDHLINGERYSQCSKTKWKGNKKIKVTFGLIKQKNKSWTATKPKWVIKPKYAELFVYGDGSVYRKKKLTDKTYERYDLKTKKTSKTSILSIIEPVAFSDSIRAKYNLTLNKNLSLIKNPDGSHQMINGLDGSFGKKILNIDSQNQVPRYGRIDPIVTTRFGGFLIRFTDGDSKYYQVIGQSGESMSPRFPAENVIPQHNLHMQNAQSRIKYLVLFNKIDDDLYWPILFTHNKYFKKPDNIKGALKESYPYWLDLNNSTNDKRYTKVDAFHKLNLLYNDGSVVVKPFDFYEKGIRSDYYSKLMNPKQNFLTKSKEYTKHKGIQVTRKGFPYFRDFYIFKNAGGKHHFLPYDWIGKGNDKKGFDSLALAKGHIDEKSSQSGILAQEGRNKESRLNQGIKDRRNAYYARLKAEKEALRRGKAHNAALKRKSTTDAWSGVSKQLTNSANKSKSRSECIRKRTATKKAALAGKQGWYDTGGCK